jgi:hypothetical protein
MARVVSLNTSNSAHNVLCCAYLPAGSDFTEQGFDCVIEYVYTAAVAGVTYGHLDSDKLQAALQAAQYFALDALTDDAVKWAKLHGVAIED